MDLQFSPEDEEYRQRLRAWLAEHSSALDDAGAVMKGAAGGVMKGAGSANIMDALQAARAWQRTLWEAGYVGLSWPREYGGQGASLTEQVILAEELARVRTPPLINTIGLTILGPTLVQHGDEQQKRRFLPRILAAEDLWCQGFSEPGAGSDLAALGTRAEVDGDELVVTGQKVWTSMAPIADWCFMLVRTDPRAPKREGISYLLCDMLTPGITVRPLRNAAGGIHFSEVFFDAVRVPVENVVGELDKGWQIARSTLEHERSGLSSVLALEETLGRVVSLGRRVERSGRAASEDQATRRALAQRWIEVEGLRHLGYRTLSAQLSGTASATSSSVGKLFASKLRQSLADLALDIEGPLAQIARKSPRVVDRGRWHAAYFDALGHSIGGGTSEILHNTIAERVLGLPRSQD